jgi:hypothetical protein
MRSFTSRLSSWWGAAASQRTITPPSVTPALRRRACGRALPPKHTHTQHPLALHATSCGDPKHTTTNTNTFLLRPQISAVFVVFSVADAIIYENTLELATSVVIGARAGRRVPASYRSQRVLQALHSRGCCATGQPPPLACPQPLCPSAACCLLPAVPRSGQLLQRAVTREAGPLLTCRWRHGPAAAHRRSEPHPPCRDPAVQTRWCWRASSSSLLRAPPTLPSRSPGAP